MTNILVEVVDSFVHGSINASRGQKILMNEFMAQDLKQFVRPVANPENKVPVANKMAAGPSENKVSTESESGKVGNAGAAQQSSASPAAQASQKTTVMPSRVGDKKTPQKGK